MTETQKQLYIAQVGELEEGKRYTGAGAGTFDPGELAEELLPGLHGSDLFTYCFRRFGYPSIGWDNHKELVRYRVTTPESDVFLEIRPHMGTDSSNLMFGYVITEEIEEEYHALLIAGRRFEWEDQPTYERVAEALSAAISDLLRPVYVRDVPINCYGRMDDSEEFELEEVEPYHAAGYPIPSCFLKDTKRYESFTDALITQGDGDMDKGIDRVILTAETIKQYKQS